MNDQAKMVSLVGAGGKKTLIYDIAQGWANAHKRVVLTNTVRLVLQSPENQAIIRKHYARNQEEAEALFQKGTYVIIGNDKEHSLPSSLEPASEQCLRECCEIGDLVLIQAENAEGKPCKVSDNHQPVIPEACCIVIGMMGMNAFGRPLKEVCCGYERAAFCLGMEEDQYLTCEDLARILVSDWGTRKHVGNRDYYIVLNHCDSLTEIKAAIKVRMLLHQYGYTKVYMTHHGSLVDQSNNDWDQEVFFPG